METLSLKLKIWRQESPQDKGQFKTYNIEGLNTHMSFLEMLDVLNGENWNLVWRTCACF